MSDARQCECGSYEICSETVDWGEPMCTECYESYNKFINQKKPYNWKSTGPGGCDAHGIEHPCGYCIK